MDVVSQNLANASTTGYVSESAVLAANPAANSLGIGDGVRVAQVQQAPDGLVQAANLQAQGALAQGTALQQALSGVQNSFPEPSSQGISQQLADFWSSWDAINQNPSSGAPYAQVVDLAQALVTNIQQASTALTQSEQDAQSQLTTTIANANSLLQQAATLNAQIVSVGASGASPNSLIDQQNAVMDQLASDIGATATTEADGSFTVRVGGLTLVQGSTADQLAIQSSGGTTSVVDSTSNLALAGLSGTASGLVSALNSYLPQYQSQLDSVANSLITSVNNQLAAGYTTSGGPGEPLFTGDSASTIAVNPPVVSNPMATLAVSNTSNPTDAANNGANAQALADLGSSPSGPDQAYTAFVQNLGAQVQAVNSQVQAQTSVANAAQSNLQAVAGVNTDQQMVMLMNYQQAYEASAKLINTISSAMQALLSAV